MNSLSNYDVIKQKWVMPCLPNLSELQLYKRAYKPNSFTN